MGWLFCNGEPFLYWGGHTSGSDIDQCTTAARDKKMFGGCPVKVHVPTPEPAGTKLKKLVAYELKFNKFTGVWCMEQGDQTVTKNGESLCVDSFAAHPLQISAEAPFVVTVLKPLSVGGGDGAEVSEVPKVTAVKFPKPPQIKKVELETVEFEEIAFEAFDAFDKELTAYPIDDAE